MPTAVVTGAGRHIGLGIAQKLHAEGYDVVAIDIDEKTARETASLVSGRGFACDVSDADQVKALADRLGEPIDLLVNNAAIWVFGALIGASPSDFERVLKVNIIGMLNCCNEFAPAMMRAGKGSIVNISSGSTAMRMPGMQIYPASKAAVEQLTGQMSYEFRPVRVNAVAPGVIPNPEAVTEDMLSRWAKEIPLARNGTPGDIANAVAFLASDQASYISGQLLTVDGGLIASRPFLLED